VSGYWLGPTPPGPPVPTPPVPTPPEMAFWLNNGLSDKGNGNLPELV